MMSLRGFGILAIALLVAACASTASRISMRVEAYSDPERPIATGESFMLVPIGAMQNELMEKELLFLLGRRLEAKGMIRVDENPDYLVALAGFITDSEEYIPPRTMYFPIPGATTSTTTSSGTVGSIPFSGTSTTTSPTTNYVPITTGGYARTNYHRLIDVIVAVPVETPEGGSAEPVWSGRVVSTGSTSDLLTVAPTLLDQLLTEFPRRSGAPPQRTVPWSPPVPQE